MLLATHTSSLIQSKQVTDLHVELVEVAESVFGSSCLLHQLDLIQDHLAELIVRLLLWEPKYKRAN